MEASLVRCTLKRTDNTEHADYTVVNMTEAGDEELKIYLSMMRSKFT